MASVLAEVTNRLAADRAPSKWDEAQKWLSFAAAVGAPTRTGTIGEAASNVSEAMGKYAAQRSATQRQSLDDKLKYLQIMGTLATKKEYQLDAFGRAWDLTGDTPRLMTDVYGRLLPAPGAPAPGAPAPGAPAPGAPAPGAPAPGAPATGTPQPNAFGVTTWNGSQYNRAFGTNFPDDATLTTNLQGTITPVFPGSRGSEKINVNQDGTSFTYERPKNAPPGTLYTRVKTDVPADPRANLTGDDLYQTLSVGEKSEVDAYRDGKRNIPPSGRVSAAAQKYIDFAQRVYNIDQAKINARYDTTHQLTANGRLGSVNVFANRALNTLVGVVDAGDALHNIGGPPGSWLTNAAGNIINPVKNFISNNPNDPRVKNFNSSNQAFVTELTKAESQGVPHNAALTMQKLNAPDLNAGPDAMRSQAASAAKLVAEQMLPAVQQYNDAYGTNYGVLHFIEDPRARLMYASAPGVTLTDDDKMQLAKDEQALRKASGAASPKAPAAPKLPDGVSADQVLKQAQAALNAGVDRASVLAKVKAMGVDPAGLRLPPQR
jgi:hypothetical protein